MIRVAILAMVVMGTNVMGCATPPPDSPAKPPSRFLSLSPASLGRSLSLSQIVLGDHDGREYRMRFELDITPARLAIVGLSPLGVTLFTIVRENGALSVKTPTKGLNIFDPRYMLFDLYLTYWPMKALQPALSRIRMRLEETSDRRIRRLRELDDTLIAEIKYPSRNSKTERIIIQHFDIPYRLRIETLEARDIK